MGLLKDVRLQRICHFKNTKLTRLVSCYTQLCVSLGTTRGSRTCTTERRFGATAKTRYYITECLLSYYLITINGGRNVGSQYSSMTPFIMFGSLPAYVWYFFDATNRLAYVWYFFDATNRLCL